MRKEPDLELENHPLLISGKVFRIARLRDEYYDYVADPRDFVEKLRSQGMRIDIFSFLSEIRDRSPKYDYHLAYDQIAVIPLITYERWWKHQISDKTRNMARKATKKGVEVRVVPFDDDLVRGIQAINDESPVRQGKPYWHYLEDFETVKQENITFLKQSDFIGAFLGAELIGYIKLVKGNGKASIMQILSKIAHRDKAPNNALMAKAVEICTEERIPYLHYAFWSRGGLGEFKENHGFERFEIPRYYIPLNRRGAIVLKCRLHHGIRQRLPQKWFDFYTHWRGKYYSLKYKPQFRAGQ
jgi:hypothetical protein